MTRVLCLYIPFLSSDRLRNAPSEAGGGARQASPIVTITSQAGALRLVHVDRTARDLDLRPGHTPADAKAIAPHLVTYDDDPQADRRQLEALAVWALSLSPIVHLEGDDTLFVDVTGCERLFGGEENLLRRAMDGLRDQGFTARGVIADTSGAAWAIAHAHLEGTFISAPGQVAADLIALPVWSLRIDKKTRDALHLVGVETVASLLHLPRASLASRFGEAVLDCIDRALGDLPEVLIPYRPKPIMTERCHFGAPTTRMDILQEAVRRTLERFCESLSKQAAGVCQLFVTFYCPDVATEQGSETQTVTLPITLSQPTRSVKHLYSLLRVLLDKLRLTAPAGSLALWTRQLEHLDDRQEELFATDSRDAQALGDLLDRLAIRLGARAVVAVEPLSEHQPERAFRYVPLVSHNDTSLVASGASAGRRSSETLRLTTSAAGGGRYKTRSRCKSQHTSSCENPFSHPTLPLAVSCPRPLRLFPRPLEVAATSVIPDGPPIAFRVGGVQHTVTGSVGPERIETGWWRGPHIKRDYYRVTTGGGRRCWLFRDRDTKRWFLHGWFD